MMRLALVLVLTGCTVETRPDAERVALAGARLLARAACSALTPAPDAPLWRRVAWALLCPPVPGVGVSPAPPPAPPSEVP